MSKYTILLVDDERNILQSLKRLLRREPYTILTASSGREGMDILENTPVDIVVSDNRMPGMTGVELMAQVKERFPGVMRIILSGYTDVDSITESINKGHVYKFVLKPWDDNQLKETIRDAAEVHRLQGENIELTEKIKKQNRELVCLNENLEIEVRKRMKEGELQNHALTFSNEILEHLSIGVIGFDADNLIVFANKLARELFEVNGRSLLTSDVRDSFEERIVELIERTADTMLCQETEYRAKNGRLFWVNCAPLHRTLKERGILLTFTELRQGGVK